MLPRRTFRLLPYRSERLPALLSLECPICLQNIVAIHAVPPAGLFYKTASLKPSSWHWIRSRAHRRRRYRARVYHSGQRAGLCLDCHLGNRNCSPVHPAYVSSPSVGWHDTTPFSLAPPKSSSGSFQPITPPHRPLPTLPFVRGGTPAPGNAFSDERGSESSA